MLVFFIHGVATREVRYADQLKKLIRAEFANRNQPLPLFYSGFWGDILNDLDKVWNGIHQDLQKVQAQDPQANPEDIFRYQSLRRGFLSEFVGDALTYFNSDRGAKIRELIATQLEDFIDRHPEETELHIVAHSLGTVVLWDVLFSENLNLDQPTLKIRSMLQGSGSSTHGRKISLRSLTTMGSPILLFNLMMGITPEKINGLTNGYQRSLKWTNVVHASDIIAYPLGSSLSDHPPANLLFKDEFIQTETNSLAKALYQLIQSPAIQKFGQAYTEALSCAPMLAGSVDAHTGYWNCQKTTDLILENLLGRQESNEGLIRAVIERLQAVPGMAECLLWSDSPLDTILFKSSFHNNCGVLQLSMNPLKIHHVHIFDREGNCCFAGYVGWVHTQGLKAAIGDIRMIFC